MTFFHRGWKIYFDYPPIPDRRFDYQASDPDGDGYPVAFGRNVAECKADIDRILEERADERLSDPDEHVYGRMEESRTIWQLRIAYACVGLAIFLMVYFGAQELLR